MNMPTTRTLSRLLAGVGVSVAMIATPLVAGGAAAASPAHNAGQKSSAPSSCRPGNYQGTVTTDRSTAGTLHYRVTLEAAPGTSGCLLQGSPKDVTFPQGESQAGVDPTSAGGQHMPVVFGPHHPVHFAITTPNTGGAPVDGAEFTLNAPGGEIPGAGAATATDPMRVDQGTLVGPVQPGV